MEKIEELMGINFERKPQFCTNVAYTTEIKILLSYSEEYQDMRLPKKEIIYNFWFIAILHSVNTIDDEYYPRVYMEECKYERVEEVSYFDNDSDSNSDPDSDSDFEEQFVYKT